jgi:putative hydrolase of the HAD superfamily
MAPKVLMVDVDGVLVRHPDPGGWSANLERDLGLPKSALQDAFFKPHWKDVIHGRTSLRDRLAPALAKIAPHLTVNQLIDYWFENDAHIDHDLLGQLRGLRSRGVEIHLATVQEHERAAYLWGTLGFGQVCNAMHYAADLGCSKPSPEFYEAIEARTGFAPSDIAFIDDSAPNIEAALARGWRAQLWRPGGTVAALFPELATT